jgi:hypothetical protein
VGSDHVRAVPDTNVWSARSPEQVGMFLLRTERTVAQLRILQLTFMVKTGKKIATRVI